MLNTAHPFSPATLLQHIRQMGGAALHHPIQIGNAMPGTAMALMQQQIPHHTPHQRQSWHTGFSGCRLEGIQQG